MLERRTTALFDARRARGDLFGMKKRAALPFQRSSDMLGVHTAVAVLFALTGCPTGPVGDDAGQASDVGAGDTNIGADSSMLTARIGAAFRESARADCLCLIDFDPEVSVDLCVSRFGASVGDVCYDTAAAASESEVAAWWNCNADAETAYAACRAGCAAGSGAACFDMRDRAVSACGAEPTFTTYSSAIAACFESRVVGTGPDTCSDTAPSSSMLGRGVFTGSTLGRGRHVPRLRCLEPGIEAGASVTHRWTAPAAGEYRIDTTGSEFIPLLQITRACGTGDLGCSSGTPTSGGGTTFSSVTLTLAAGQSVQISLVGRDVRQAGNYSINITAL